MCDSSMKPCKELKSPEEVFEFLANCRINSPNWLFRGQSTINQFELKPTIDRYFSVKVNESNKEKARILELSIERQCIERFRTALKQTDETYEQLLLRDDIYAMALMQHYGGPSRFLDWSFNPYVAAYFATSNPQFDDQDALIWCFDEIQYDNNATKLWKEKFPEVYVDGKFNNRLTHAFEKGYFNDWIVCQFLNYPFPRIHAQEGAFTFCSQFDKDHAKKLKEMLDNENSFKVFLFKAKRQNKKLIRKTLREKLGIWYGEIYPDLSGVATGINEIINDLESPSNFV